MLSYLQKLRLTTHIAAIAILAMVAITLFAMHSFYILNGLGSDAKKSMYITRQVEELRYEEGRLLSSWYAMMGNKNEEKRAQYFNEYKEYKADVLKRLDVLTSDLLSKDASKFPNLAAYNSSLTDGINNLDQWAQERSTMDIGAQVSAISQSKKLVKSLEGLITPTVNEVVSYEQSLLDKRMSSSQWTMMFDVMIVLASFCLYGFLTWKIASRNEREGSRAQSCLEGLGNNVLIANENDELIYANKASIRALTELSTEIRKTFTNFDVAGIMGKSIHQFHKNPEDIKQKLRSLTEGKQHKANIAIGSLTFSLNVGGVFDARGKRIGSYAEWRDITREREVEDMVDSTARTISEAISDISQGNMNLSERTEAQAANIEETTASMQQITEKVSETASNAKKALEMASQTRDAANQGGQVVEDAIKAMGEITTASKKINEIISVIDEIAFQTNLLALNAAVEAARAGEQGRGFAVVASEVRTLAGRSAEAAKEIKDLITDSVNKVEQGTRMVNDTGESLEAIITNVENVVSMVNGISAASQEQALGVEEVNKAIVQMDSFTQQNAALVEEAASASSSLSEQAASLVSILNADAAEETSKKKEMSSSANQKQQNTAGAQTTVH